MLAEILFYDRASAQYPGRDPEELDALVQTIIPQTRSIPVRYLAECYVVALEQRKPDDNFQIRGVELINAWKVIAGRIEMESKGAYSQKQLPTNAAATCQRCYGTGMERMPNGTVRPGCAHVPMTETEEDEIKRHRMADAEFIQDQAELMREALRQIGNLKPVPVAVAPKQKGVRLVCDACGRKVNTLYGSWEVGDECGDLLNRGCHDGELKSCEGIFGEVK